MTNSLLNLYIGTLTLIGLSACPPTGGSKHTGDTGATTDTSEPGNHDSSDTNLPDASFETISDPCSGATPYSIYFESPTEGWVGCGSSKGLHHTTDGGETFESALPSGNLYVLDIEPDPSGGILVCGHDYDNDDVLLYRSQGSDWEPLLSYGSNSSDSSWAYLSNCGNVAAAGDGTIIVSSNTIGDITWSQDNGASWSTEERYWEDANLDPGGYSAYGIMRLQAAAGQYYGSGSNIIEPPVFFSPSLHEDGTWHNFSAASVDESVEGEGWSLATPDNGDTWLMGGRDQSASGRASGFLYRSTDGGESWQSITLGETIDIIYDIAFSEDGQHGVAVGHRYPPSSLGGFALLTDNAGETWSELDQELPILQSAEISGTTFWIGGEYFMARGNF